MAIRIVRNEAGNCINFYGSSNPTYWNACLSGEVDSTDPNTVNVINDIITSQTGTTQYEFFRVPYTEFTDADGNAFASAQETADYITEKANVIGLSGEGIDLTNETVCFSLDATSTSIMLDTGHAFGVNTIKAIPHTDGTVHIVSNDGADNITHFRYLGANNVCVNGVTVTGGLNDVVNALNELFTVGAFESVVISDPYSTMVADVAGVDIVSPTYVGANSIDPVGADVFGASAAGSLNGYLSTETIDQAGEYFTFDIRVEGVIGMGLVHSQASYDNGYYSGNATYANPANFGTYNSQHGGFQFSHWFHPTPNGPWTNYGANTGYIQGSGWSNATLKFSASPEGADWLAGNPVKMRVGIDANGFISIDYYDVSESTWIVCARTSYASVEGVEYRLGIKMGDTNVRLNTLPKIHELEPAAPTMYFRYIESPDNNFHYPLFATAEEANYYDLQNGGTGTSSVNVFPDEPTFAQWYIPTNGYTNNGTSAPTSAILFEGNPINWTEITSLTNADLAPTAFSDTTVTVNELSAVNIQVTPADASYTTTITDNDSSGLTLIGSNIEGSAPEVTGDNVANPSDTYTITVTHTNSYGSSTGTLTIIVNNLTAPVTTISGFNHVTGSTAMIDADTMNDGSVVHINTTVADGERFVIEKAYVEANILPNLNAANDMYIIGLENTSADFSTLELSDFDAAIVWEYETASSHTFKFYRDGSVVQNIVVNSMTQAFYDYAIEINGTSAWLIACNVNSIMNEPSPADGGVFSNTYEATSIEDTAPVTIHMATLNTIGDISTSDLTTLTTPAAPTGNLTNWTKAVDFSGGSEYLSQVSTNNLVNPLMMGGLSVTTAAPTTTGNTSNDSNARPWATAVVFSTDNISSNQHVWNLGEGAGSTDDNIYLRVSSSGDLYFGWGRQDAVNEYLIRRNIGSNWFGVYVGYNGTRLSGANATASNLAAAFDIKTMFYSGGNWIFDPNPTYNGIGVWTTTGGRMDRQFIGSFTVGGRGSNRNFHGKVASMVVTTLRRNVAMPNDTEIEMMITDPVKWINDYKEGNQFRYPATTQESTFTKGSTLGYAATQVWLMGDGTSDSYANGIRNEVLKSDQNWTKLQLNSMVSNDIENVNISGLS